MKGFHLSGSDPVSCGCTDMNMSLKYKVYGPSLCPAQMIKIDGSDQSKVIGQHLMCLIYLHQLVYCAYVIGVHDLSESHFTAISLRFLMLLFKQ